MYVCVGAAAALRTDERRRFLENDWPKVRAIITRLGLGLDELLQAPSAPAAHKDDDKDDDKDDEDGHEH